MSKKKTLLDFKKMKNKIIKILDRYINEYPDILLEKRSGKKTYEMLCKIREEIKLLDK